MRTSISLQFYYMILQSFWKYVSADVTAANVNMCCEEEKILILSAERITSMCEGSEMSRSFSSLAVQPTVIFRATHSSQKKATLLSCATTFVFFVDTQI